MPSVGERYGVQAGASVTTPTLSDGGHGPAHRIDVSMPVLPPSATDNGNSAEHRPEEQRRAGHHRADQREESVPAVSAWSAAARDVEPAAEPDTVADAVVSSSVGEATTLGIPGDGNSAGRREQTTTAAAEVARARLTAPSGGSSAGHSQASVGTEDDAVERWAAIGARLARSEVVDVKEVAAEFGIAERTARTSVQRSKQLLALARRIEDGSDISAVAVAAEFKIPAAAAQKLLDRARRPLVAERVM